MCVWCSCYMSDINVLLNLYKLKIKKRKDFIFNSDICTTYNHGFCYNLEGFHLWFPCHILVSCFRELPIYHLLSVSGNQPVKRSPYYSYTTNSPKCCYLYSRPGTVTESVEHGPRMQEFGSWSSQTSDLYNWYSSIPSLALSINRIWQGLVCSVSG